MDDAPETMSTSYIPEGITHRYLRLNSTRFGLHAMDWGSLLRLQQKLEEIDFYINRPTFVKQFLEDIDDHGSFEKALAYNSQIQGLSYEGGTYGFFDTGWDASLTMTQKMRLEYASILIKDAVQRWLDVPLWIKDIAQRHQAEIQSILSLPS